MDLSSVTRSVTRRDNASATGSGNARGQNECDLHHTKGVGEGGGRAGASHDIIKRFLTSSVLYVSARQRFRTLEKEADNNVFENSSPNRGGINGYTAKKNSRVQAHWVKKPGKRTLEKIPHGTENALKMVHRDSTECLYVSSVVS